MGKIFSPSELERGLVPREGNHMIAAEIIVGKLDDASAVTRPIAIQIYGSVAEGCPTIGSDVDLLVIYDEARQEPTLGIVMNAVDCAEKTTQVPVEASVVGYNQALRGDFRFDPFYLRHLHHAEKRDPIYLSDLQ